MIAIKILVWLVLICMIIIVLATFGAIIYASLIIVPIVRRERLLKRFGYEYDKGYFVKGDVSIPVDWIEKMSLSRLEDYLARREEHGGADLQEEE